jgi:hypothetical protein
MKYGASLPNLQFELLIVDSDAPYNMKYGASLPNLQFELLIVDSDAPYGIYKMRENDARFQLEPITNN